MEKDQTPENTTDTNTETPKPDELKAEVEQPAESDQQMDPGAEDEQAGSIPEAEPASEPEPETEPEPEKPTEPQQALPDLTASQLTESDPLNKTLAYGGFFLFLLVIILVGASLMNTSRFYVDEHDGAVEVWQGRFSPKAKKQLVIMPGVEAPVVKKDVYTKQDVYPIIFQYYLDKSDALLDVPGLPDFYGIKDYLNKALTYATTEAEIQKARNRINSVDLTVLLYKADRSIGDGTIDGLQAAEAYLGRASELNPDEITAGLIRQKLVSIERMKAALNAEASMAAEQSQAPAQTATDAPPAGSETAAESDSEAIGTEEKGDSTQNPHSTPEKPATEEGKSEQSF